MKNSILAYKNEGDLKLYSFRDENDLEHTSRELLKAGIFNGLFIIDSAGNQYRLKNVQELGWANAFWGISLTRKGRQIRVQFDFEFVSNLSLDQIKEFVLGRLQWHNNEFWIDDLYEMVKDAKSIDQIIMRFE